MEQETKKKSKTIQTVVGLVVGLSAYFLVQQLFFKPQSFDKAMMTVASDVNKSCPIMVDQETRLDNTIALPENVFQYNYTLVNLLKESVDVNVLREKIEPTIINSVKTSPDLKDFREHRVTMGYHYKDKNGVFLFKILITPDKYTN